MPIPLGILAVAGAGAAGGGSFDLLETVTPTGTTTLTFTGLDTYTQYKHLQIRFTHQNATPTFSQLQVRLNSDTGSNYARHALFGDGSTVQSTANTSATFMQAGGSSNTANQFTAGVIDILDFSSSSKNTTIRALSGYPTGSPRIWFFSGFWNNTAAVTSITLLDSAANFATGSRFSLYGIK